MLYSVYTYGPFPEIDGVLDASEWSDATMLVLGDQTLYVKNTENMLYIAYVDGQDVSLDTDDAFYVEIEDNHNLRWPALEGSSEGEYRVTAADGGTSEATYQGIWGTYPGGIGRDIRGPYDEVVGAVGGGDGSPVIYELSIEIDPDDLAAVNSSMGSVVGFRFASYDAGALEWTKVWLSGSDATDPESFGNLMLGIGAGGPNFSVWYSAYEVWLYESETTTRPMWVSNLGNGSIDYALYESYLPFWGDGGRSSGHPVLLYTDEASTVGEEALTFLGYGYDVVTTQTDFLSYLEPEDYDVVIVTKLTALAATELAKIKNFLWHGGKVIITCPDLEGTNSNVLWEEAGLQIYADLGATPSAINWDVPDHPVFDTPLDVPPSVETVEGVYTDYGDGILSDGATILASHDELPYPANGAITLSSDGAMFLNSFVMSDSRDSDFDDMADGVELLINELFYLAALEEVPWLDVDIEEGTLTSHQTHNAIVTFDATSLVEGDYEGYIIATSSDPATPVVSVPCILHVCEPDFALVRLAFPSESQMVSPGEDFELPITAEGLNDAGITDLTITVQTVSSVVSPVNVTSDDYEVTVTGYDLDYITFELSSDILMDDGVICNVEFAVPTTAPVASFCNIAIDDVEYNAGAFVEAIEKINGRVVIEAGEMDWLVELDFTHGSFADEIEIGVTPGATDAFDEEIDVLNDPPSHWFDPYSDISAFDPVYGELDGDIRSPYDDMVEWTIPVGDSAGKLEWSFRDEDTLSYMGSLFLNGDINMKEAPFYYLFEAGETLTIIYRKTGESPFDIVLYPGWNMVSLPIVPVEVDATPAGVYPDAEYTYYYDATTGMWTAASAIEPGVGYAVLALSEQQYTLWGQPVSFYTYDLTRGWNLIGTTYDEVDFSSPTTNPPGAVMGAPEHAYYYDILLGDYTRTDELTPGNGYFVAAQNDAVLSVPGVSGKKALVPTTDYSVQIQVVVDGESKTLTLGASSVDWLMPIPPAPDGSVPEAYLSVDGWRAKAAYCNDAVACDLVVSGCAEVTASGLPEGLNAFVSVDGKKLPLDESAILPAAGSYKITVGDLPRQFALHANVPNPFNPTTAIRFDIPERCEVKLDVYDLLGNKVTTLQDGELSTGRHTVLWDGVDISGQPVPSGVYFYRLVAGEKKATRRMLLLK